MTVGLFFFLSKNRQNFHSGGMVVMFNWCWVYEGVHWKTKLSPGHKKFKNPCVNVNSHDSMESIVV